MIARPSPALPSAAVAVLLFSLVTSTVSENAAAQCATQWLAGPGVTGTNGGVAATTIWDPDGAGPIQPILVVAGGFTIAGTVMVNTIAAYDPVTGAWSALGSGINPGGVGALTTMGNGDLVAGGYFTAAGGVSANSIARWNGTSWSALGSGVNDIVLALTTLPNGDLVAGGYFTAAGGVSANYIARWNGTSWSALGSGMNDIVYALTTLPNGDLVAGGWFTTAGGVSANRIARWDGTSWSPLGSGLGVVNGVVALTTLPNGDLVAGGYFGAAWGGGSANYIARWNGTNWSALGAGMDNLPLALTTLPNGDLVAGGYFTAAGGVSANYIARWNGTSWSALGSGISGGGPLVMALAVLPNGDLVAGGLFTWAGGVIAYNIAQLTTTCPATAVSYGAGCTGSGGPNVLAATSLPWIGSTFRSVATGMPAPSLALSVFGFSTLSIPMPSILPQGVPGCTLLVSPDLLYVYVPAAGIVQTQLVLPNTAALVGGVFHQQVVPVELSGTGDITALTGTNALTLTIGSF